MTDADDDPGRPAADPPLDRTISPISGRLGGAAGGKVLAFAGLLAGCGVFAFATWSADRPRPEKPPERPARQVVAFEPKPVSTLPDLPPPPSHVEEGPYVPAIETTPATPGPGLAGAARSPTPRAAPLMAWSRTPLARPPEPSATMPTAVAEAGDLDRLSRTRSIARVPATSLGDRSLLLLAGTTIPCILQTAMDSSTPGLAVCVIPVDVWSDNGGVLLLEKGTRVLGEHRGGLRQGQRRIFVVWSRAVTPHGVAVEFASPATDALGRGGFDGHIDTRFWDRFGAALLLSIVSDAGDALRDGDDRSTRLPSDAAAIAVDRGADIAPVLRKAQGTEVAILTARDFDFSGVYRLRRASP